MLYVRKGGLSFDTPPQSKSTPLQPCSGCSTNTHAFCFAAGVVHLNATREICYTSATRVSKQFLSESPRLLSYTSQHNLYLWWDIIGFSPTSANVRRGSHDIAPLAYEIFWTSDKGMVYPVGFATGEITPFVVSKGILLHVRARTQFGVPGPSPKGMLPRKLLPVGMKRVMLTLPQVYVQIL